MEILSQAVHKPKAPKLLTRIFFSSPAAVHVHHLWCTYISSSYSSKFRCYPKRKTNPIGTDNYHNRKAVAEVAGYRTASFTLIYHHFSSPLPLPVHSSCKCRSNGWVQLVQVETKHIGQAFRVEETNGNK